MTRALPSIPPGIRNALAVRCRAILPRLSIPGLFITGTDTGVGKTVVASAIVDHFVRRGVRVGAFKPIASGCAADGAGGLVCEDAARLSAATRRRFSAAQICPVTFADATAPGVAAKRIGRPVDWARVRAALDAIVSQSDILIVEGAGGLHVPLSETVTVFDLIRALGLPALCVSRPGLGTINHTLLTVEALRQARAECAGVVVNRFPMRDASLADTTSVSEIERMGGGPVRCVVPESYYEGYTIPQPISDVIDTVDWSRLARFPAGRSTNV